MNKTIIDIVRKVRKETLTKEELESLYTLTSTLLEQIGDLRGKNYPKELRSKYSRQKNALWSIRCSIRYRLDNI